MTLAIKSRIPVAVIGSAMPKQGSVEFSTARELGRELAKAGLIVACGGRTGVMEAVSLGCHEAGGISIGILPSLDGRERALLDRAVDRSGHRP
ncbi:MAG TPA: hypothetical protein VNW24_00075 [Stellaceae bacterium]|nr:hypothetical protein [Stellaceae bacterium]